MHPPDWVNLRYLKYTIRLSSEQILLSTMAKGDESGGRMVRGPLYSDS